MIKLERLQARLDAVGLTANAASQLAGFGRDYVRDLLREKVRDPSFSRLLRLAEVLRCSTEYLTGDSEFVGDMPMVLKVSQTILLPVSAKVRPGYFEAGANELVEPFDWNVGMIGLVQHHEWLEYVERSPSVGIDLPEECLIHVIGTRGALREGQTVLCILKHPEAQLFTRAAFNVHILEPDYDDYVELQDAGRSRDQGRRQFLSHAASGLLSGENELGIQVVGQIAAIYRYLDQQTLERLREKTRTRG